jgi:hypothetical protein
MGTVGGTAAAGFGVHVFGIRQTGNASIGNPSFAGAILGCASDWKIRSWNSGMMRRIIDIRLTGRSRFLNQHGRQAPPKRLRQDSV